MKQFEYNVKDKLGIHARPAGLIVKESANYSSSIMIQKGEKTADAKKLFALMGLGVKYDDNIIVTVEGQDEDAAYEALKQLIESNL